MHFFLSMPFISGLFFFFSSLLLVEKRKKKKKMSFDGSVTGCWNRKRLHRHTHTHTFEMNREGGAVCNLRVRNTQKKKLKSLLLWDPHQRASTKERKKNVIVRMYSNIDRTGLNIFASIWLVYFHVNFASWLQSGGGKLFVWHTIPFFYI